MFFNENQAKSFKKAQVEHSLEPSHTAVAASFEEYQTSIKTIRPEGISTFHDNDVLSGRGGGTNVHRGNRTFRNLINQHRREYLKAKKNDKPVISKAIVKAIRDSGGRFLKKDSKSNLWFEIGDTLAREKTSQALRQRASKMRKILLQNEPQKQSRIMSQGKGQQKFMLHDGTGRNMLHTRNFINI